LVSVSACSLKGKKAISISMWMEDPPHFLGPILVTDLAQFGSLFINIFEVLQKKAFRRAYLELV
jgi:hypothetical protein